MLEWVQESLRLRDVCRITGFEAVLDWAQEQAKDRDAVAAVDAPLVIVNPSGIRAGERALNREFRQYHAGCHPANLGRPFAESVTRFSRNLETIGFEHQPDAPARGGGRFQIEVHPHAASVSLFRLDRIVKYKRGSRVERATGLARFRDLLDARLAVMEPQLSGTAWPAIPIRGDLKPAEDQIDAIFCAYLAAYWWWWGATRNTVFGDAASGYIVVPRPA